MKKNFKLITMIIIIMVLAFTFAACNIGNSDGNTQNNNSNVDNSETKSIVGIKVEGPIEIKAFTFDYANYKLIITYSDKTKEEVALKSSMISKEDKELLNIEGAHSIDITYKEMITSFNIIVKSAFDNYENIKLEDKEFVFDGLPHSLEVTGAPSNAIIVYNTPNKITDAGQYIVSATITIGDVSLDRTAIMLIKKARIDMSNVRFESKTITYDGEYHSLKVDNLPLGVDVVYENNNQKAVGEYIVQAKFPSSKNYEDIEPLTATLTIKPAILIGYELVNSEYTYDTTQKSISLNKELPSDANITYYINDDIVDNKFVNAGTYNVVAKITGDKYKEVVLQGKLTIKPAILSYSIYNNTIRYDREEHNVQPRNITGLYPGDEYKYVVRANYETIPCLQGTYTATVELTNTVDGYMNYVLDKETFEITITREKHKITFVCEEFTKVIEVYDLEPIYREDFPKLPPIKGYDRKWSIDEMLAYADVTAECINTPIQYYINYDLQLNGANNLNTKNSYTIEDGTYSLLDAEGSKYFVGWMCNDKYVKKLDYDFVSENAVNNNITLVAQWTTITPSQNISYSFDESIDGYVVTNISNVTDKNVEIASVYNGKPVKKIDSKIFGNEETDKFNYITIPKSVEFVSQDAFLGIYTMVIRCESEVIPSTYEEGWNIYHRLDERNYECPVILDCRHNKTAQDGYRYEDIILGSNINTLVGIKNNKAKLVKYSLYNNVIELPYEVTINSSKTYMINEYGDFLMYMHKDRGFYDLFVSPNIEKIGDYALVRANRISLKDTSSQVKLFHNVKEIGNVAFYWSEALVDLSDMPNLEVIGDYALNNRVDACKIINEKKTTLKYIGTHAFSVASDILYLPSSIKHIGDNAFEGTITYMNVESKPQDLFVGTENRITFASIKTNVDGFKWYIDNNNEGSIIDYFGNNVSDFNIPSQIDNVKITSIKENTFLGASFNTLTIPNTIKEIRKRAFSGTGITAITFEPNSSLTYLSGFSYCQISKIEIPESVKEIGEYAFNNSYNLAEIIFKGNSLLETIGAYAFSNTQITGIIIPNSVVRIEEYAFSKNKNLNNVVYQSNSNLQFIGDRAFSECNFETFRLPKGIKTVGNELLYNNLAVINNIYMPSGIENLGRDMILGSKFPEKQQPTRPPYPSDWWKHEINIYFGLDQAYYYKDWLINSDNYKPIIYKNYNDTITDAEFSGYYDDNGDLTITGYKGNQEIVTIPSTIQGYRPLKIKNLTVNTLVLPDTVKAVKGEFVFVFTPKAKENISINNTNVNGITHFECKEIGETLNYKWALKNDNSLVIYKYIGSEERLEIPNELQVYKVTEIGTYAFNSTAMKEVVIPANIKVIQTNAFTNSNISFIEVEMLANNVNIESLAFNRVRVFCSKDNVSNFDNIAEKIQIIRDYAGQKGVTEDGYSWILRDNNTINIVDLTTTNTSITIPTTINNYNVVKIDSYALNNIEYDSKVYINAHIKEIGENIFKNNSITIFTNVSQDEAGWNKNWNNNNCRVVYNYGGEEGVTADGFKWAKRADNKAYIIGYEGMSSNIVIPDQINTYVVNGIDDGAFKKAPYNSEIVIGDNIKVIGKDIFDIGIVKAVYCSADAKLNTWDESWVPNNDKVYYSYGGQKGKTDQIEWFLKKNGSIEIIKIETTNNRYTIPKEIEGYSVDHLRKELFKDNKTIEFLVIPNTIKIIESNLVSNSNIKRIYCETKAKEALWDESFNIIDATNKCVVIWDYINNDVADDNAKYFVDENGNEIKLVNEGAIILSLRDAVAGNYIMLSTVNHFGNIYNVVGFKEGLFNGNLSLENVTLSQHLLTISDMAFEGCSNLKSITLPDSLISIGERAFYGCNSLEGIKLPNNLQEIKALAFAECIGLREVIIPLSVTAIGEYAFKNCSKFLVIRCEGSSNTGWNELCFNQNETNKAIVIMDYLNSNIGIDGNMYEDIGDLIYRLHSNGIADIIQIKASESFNGVLTIPGSVSYNQTNYLVNNIGDEQFANCNIITEVHITKIDTIGCRAFYNCDNLVKITIAEVSYIKQGAITHCDKLQFIKIIKITKRLEECIYSCPALEVFELISGELGAYGADFTQCGFGGCPKLSLFIGYNPNSFNRGDFQGIPVYLRYNVNTINRYTIKSANAPDKIIEAAGYIKLDPPAEIEGKRFVGWSYKFMNPGDLITRKQIIKGNYFYCNGGTLINAEYEEITKA